MKELNEKHLDAVRKMGFGSLVHFDVKEVPGKLAFWLLSNFEPVSYSIPLLNPRRLHIGEEDVELTFGFPRGDMMIKRQPRQKNLKLLDEVAADSGRGKYMMSAEYVVEQMMKDTTGGEWFKKLFLLLMEHALIEGSADGYVKSKIVEYIDDVSNVKRYNWCHYLLTVLIKTHATWIRK